MSRGKCEENSRDEGCGRRKKLQRLILGQVGGTYTLRHSTDSFDRKHDDPDYSDGINTFIIIFRSLGSLINWTTTRPRRTSELGMASIPSRIPLFKL